MPPSPSLSARMMKKMYLTVTTIVSAHTMSDSTPNTFSGVGVTLDPDGPPGITRKHSFIAYSGLVPMSP